MARSILTAGDKAELARLGGRVRFDEPLSRHTTLKIGGPADAWIAPDSATRLAKVIQYCIERELPMLSIGGGSNLLVHDSGIRGVVLSTRALRKIERTGDNTIEAESGVSTGKLLSSATQWELGGLEFLGGVPGSVGGGMVMNAGTYLGEFKDVTTQVQSLRLTNVPRTSFTNAGAGVLVTRTNQECQFVYRGSALPPDEIVVAASFHLPHRSREEIQLAVKELRARRKEREPTGASNAGSVFKNPAGDYAGRLLEDIGFKGTRVGQAECSMVHANWFVNHGGATAADMKALIDRARAKVRAKHGVELVLEWKCIGEE